MTPAIATLGIAALSTLGVIVRPFRMPEYVFAALGALLTIVLGLLAWPDALAAVLKGTDVYFFLIGMMLLAELARREGLFDYLAALAVREAKGSSSRLFAIVYGVGILVTVFLSNDATAVVLTPAVYAAAKHARVNPLPYLFACAFIANAASFGLPISNPANLVIYGAAMPPLGTWLLHLLIPALLAILATFIALRVAVRRDLAAQAPRFEELPRLGRGGRLVAIGIGLTAIVLLSASALGADLGLPTLVAGAAVAMAVTLLTRHAPLPLVRHISWGVLPLVAGLFVLVEAVFRTGALAPLIQWLHQGAGEAPLATAAVSGIGVAVFSNLINNLPMGLIAATAGHAAQVPPRVTEALLIGVDLGPNLSVTGSLATILWLVALRRENLHVGARQFLKLGLFVMPPALIVALGALMVMPG